MHDIMTPQIAATRSMPFSKNVCRIVYAQMRRSVLHPKITWDASLQIPKTGMNKIFFVSVISEKLFSGILFLIFLFIAFSFANFFSFLAQLLCEAVLFLFRKRFSFSFQEKEKGLDPRGFEPLASPMQTERSARLS